MTMKLTIKNEDAQRVAHVSVEDRSIHTGELSLAQSATIYAGQEQSFYIHAARRLVIHEVADASIPSDR